MSTVNNINHSHGDNEICKHMEELFEIKADGILPHSVNIIEAILLVNKHNISFDEFIKYVDITREVSAGMTRAVDGILSETDLDLDWSDPQILEGFVSRASSFIAEEKRNKAAEFAYHIIAGFMHYDVKAPEGVTDLSDPDVVLWSNRKLWEEFESKNPEKAAEIKARHKKPRRVKRRRM